MQLTVPNITKDAPDGSFYVSYNATDYRIYGDETTALVWGQMQGFYILNGDHRAAYADLIPQGWAACYAYYLSRPDLHNSMSDRQFPPLTAAQLLARA